MAIEKSEGTRPEENKEQKPQQPSISPEMAQKLMDEIEKLKSGQTAVPVKNEDQTADLMKQLVEGLQQKKDSEVYGGQHKYVDEDQIDPDDLLSPDEYETFFTYKTGYVVVDDKRQGVPVRTPFSNVIEFAYQATRTKQVGKEVELFNFASYTSKSKKEVAWLKSHSLYGIVFFESIDSDLSHDSVRAAKLVKYMTSLSGLGQVEIAKMANDHGIPLMNSVQKMRIAIASHLADKELEANMKEAEIRLNDSSKAQELLESKP